MKKLFGLSLGLLLNSAFAGTYIVKMNAPLSKNGLERVTSIKGVESVEKFTPYKDAYFDKLYLINFNEKDYSVDLLRNSSLVDNVEKSFEATMFEIKANPKSKMVTNDMLFPKQWGVFNQKPIIVKQKLRGGDPLEFFGVEGIDIGWVKKEKVGEKEVIKDISNIEKNLKKTPVVAVIDTGIDIDHVELKDQILKNEAECNADGTLPVDRSQDKDNNGYKADCYGYNFAATDPSFIQLPLDDKNHGTHVAGIIAAKRNNNEGIAGVSDKIKILPVKVTGFVDETRERNNLILKAPSERIARGILYAVARGVDVINLSLGWPKSMDTEFMRRAIMIAQSKNISIVAAAGNNNTNGNIYPCAYQGVICVGSVDANGQVSAFSNYGGEVDILAPGDQILSTIPSTFAQIKMNIYGYDIMSGTSQAAPYVAATVALLKATYPGISKDEIKGRLHRAASKKPDVFKSMAGILNIQKTFEDNATDVNVVPIFKSRISYKKEGNKERFNISERSEILFNKTNGTFVFPLYLHNIGADLGEEKVKVSVHFHSRAIGLKSNTFYLGKEELKRPLGIRGQLKSKYIDNKVKYSVVVQRVKLDEETGMESVTSRDEYIHEVSIAKMSVIIGQNKKVIGGMKINLNQDLAENESLTKGFHKFLRTVEEKFIHTDFPTYYLKYQPTEAKNEDEDGIRLYFFNKTGNSYSQQDETYFAPKAVKLLEVTKGDYNYDGKADYLIKTIIQPDEINGEKQPGYILYSYRTMDMQPLVGKFSDITYTPEIVNVTPKTVRLSRTELPNGKVLATPNFVTTGVVPEEDQPFDPWTKKDRSKLRRVYYLEIIDGDMPSFKARTFQNLSFIRSARKQLKSFDDQTISNNDTVLEIVQLQNQTAQDYYSNKVVALASYGLGDFRTNVKLIINKDKYQIEPAAYLSETLLGFDHQSVINISGNKMQRNSDNAYVGFITSDIISVTSDDNADENNFVFRNRDENDKILSFLSLFKNGNTRYMFMETIDYVMLVTETNGEQKIAKRKTKKFSFLPGSKMSELYYPIVIKSRNNQLKPAIYIDATQLSNNNVYLNTLINDELVAPVDLSLAVPSYCTAKNPYPTKRGNFRYVLLCNYGGEQKVIFEDLVSP